MDWEGFANSIMTTDTFPKGIYKQTRIGNKVVKLVGIELDAIISVTVAVQREQQSNKVGDIVSWCSFGDPHDAVGRQNTGRVGVGAQGNFAKFELNGLIGKVKKKPVLISR